MSGRAHPWWVPLAAVAGTALLRSLGASWRVERRDDPAYTEAAARGERLLLTCWHARLLPLVHLHRGEGLAVLVSRHHDGEVIARIVESLGFVTARGSSTRGAETGVREMLRLARRGHSLAITPDGPKGPAEEIKSGLIYLAARLQLRIVPIAAAADRAWVGRSWDRFRVPKPFARVCIAHAAPIAVPAAAAEGDAAETVRLEVQSVMRDLHARVRAAAGERA